MRRPMHGKYFNYVYVAALVLIVMVFAVIAYWLATNDVSIEAKSFNAVTMVVAAGIVIGILALLTGAFYVAIRLDSRLTRPNQYEPFDENEPANYGAPRIETRS